jgi:flagellar FliJ protein
MADLDPLIRVRKHTVEQKQKFLADLYRQSEQMAAQKKKLEDDVVLERKKMEEMNSVEMMTYFSNYLKAVKQKIAGIDEGMRKLDGRIEVAREAMREAFAELKKIEITQERREAEEEAALDKKESDLMDDIAIEGFRRKMDEKT